MFLAYRKVVDLADHKKYGVPMSRSGSMEMTVIHMRDESSTPYGDRLAPSINIIYAECKNWRWAKTYRPDFLVFDEGDLDFGERYPETNEELAEFLVAYEDVIWADFDKEIENCIKQFV